MMGDGIWARFVGWVHRMWRGKRAGICVRFLDWGGLIGWESIGYPGIDIEANEIWIWGSRFGAAGWLGRGARMQKTFAGLGFFFWD